MNIEMIRDYLLSKPSATEDMPFGDTVIAFRVGEKIFALLAIDKDPLSINLKCKPDRALEYRAGYLCVVPGYHMNKKHWNTLHIQDDCTWSLVKELVDHSYDLVYASLPKAIIKALQDD